MSAKTKIYVNKPSGKSVNFEKSSDLEYLFYIMRKVNTLLERIGLEDLELDLSDVEDFTMTYVNPVLMDESYASEFVQGILAGLIIGNITGEVIYEEEEEDFYD